VRFPDIASLPEAAEALTTAEDGVTASIDRDRLVVTGAPEAAWVTRTLADAGIYLSELRAETKNLESVFLELTGTAPVPGRTVQIGESIEAPASEAPITVSTDPVTATTEGVQQ
jgi:ABC-2 type transport system ATP-binding protein